MANRVSKRNNVLKALAGTNWGQQRETLLMTYKALGRSITNYAEPVWSTNASESNIGKIQRLDTENVCHHITNMDHPQREMKKTIFTTHNQTVLPLLANNRKDTLQALHTSFANTAIDNMKDNRLLNNRPPPINDEETLLSRRQRANLSHLCSGHCKMMNSYKKRLK